MANICRTDIRIEASEYAIKSFIEKYEGCHDGKYPNKEEIPHIVDVFGADAELFIDKVGSKWVTKYDVYYEGLTVFEFGLESAWYPPSDMLKEMYRQLVDRSDSDVIFTARYWDEAYDPIGVLKIVGEGEILSLETEPEPEDEYEGEWYWDDVIDPEFERLEKELNI